MDIEISSNYILRKARIADQLHIIQLITGILDTYGLAIDTKYTDRDLFDLDSCYFRNGGWFSVLENEEKMIIGSYGLIKVCDSQCELRKMYIDPLHQGKGLGKLMMREAFEKALDFGYKTMILETNRKLFKAIKLYEKSGFTIYKPSHLSDRCDIGMKKDLRSTCGSTWVTRANPTRPPWICCPRSGSKSI